MAFNQVLSPERRFLSCDSIHPLKQESVAQLVECARKQESVEFLVVFGSALTRNCTPWSDVDYVVSDPTHKFMGPGCDAFDKFYADDLDPSWAIWPEIMKNGVYVYVREWEHAGYRQTPPPEYRFTDGQ